MIEHCISALNFNREKEHEARSFKIYVTDALMAIAENTIHHYGFNGIEDIGFNLNSRWLDIIEPPKTVPVDDRPCEDIAKDIFARIRGEK